MKRVICCSRVSSAMRAASLALIVLGVVKPLSAQEPAAPFPEPTPIPSPSAASSPAPDEARADQGPDRRHPRPAPQAAATAADPPDYKKRMVAGAPVIGYSPTSGVSVGVAGNVAFYRGFPQTTRISSIVASATATTKAQILVSAKFNVSSFENRWRLEADNRFFWTSQPTYGLGTSTPEDA